MSQTSQNKEPEKRSQLEIEQEEENRKIRRLQLMMNMVMSVLAQDEDLTLEQASEMIANARFREDLYYRLNSGIGHVPRQGARLRFILPPPFSEIAE